MNRRAWITMSAVSGLLLAGLMYQARGPARHVVDPSFSSTVNAAEPASPSHPQPAVASPVTLERMAGADRLFELGYAGGVVIDSQAKSALERLMGDMPDPPSAADERALEDALRKGLPQPDAEKILQLLARYRQYDAALTAEAAAMTGLPSSAQEMRALQARTHELRKAYFDEATLSALFGDQEARELRAITQYEIEHDPTLSVDERRARLARLGVPVVGEPAPKPEATPPQDPALPESAAPGETGR